MGLSYEFSIGSVSAKEKYLFTNSDIEQMLACKNIDELCRLLCDKGYGDGDTVDEVIESHTKELWSYLKSITPDFEIFSPFIIQNDIHNLKVVLKGTMSYRDYKNLLVTPNTIDFNVIEEAVKNRKFSLFPEWLAKLADEAYEILAHKSDARACDAIIDAAAMKEMLVMSQKYSKFLSEYFKTLIFYNDIKISIRCARTGTTKDFLQKALVDVDGFRKEEVIAAALKGITTLEDELSKRSEYDCNIAIEEYKNSPSDFEKFVDNKLIKMAKERCKFTREGAEPLIGFYLGNIAEKTVIHIIASGIRTKSDESTIRERLREIYG